jgi:hypothetical protein
MSENANYISAPGLILEHTHPCGPGLVAKAGADRRTRGPNCQGTRAAAHGVALAVSQANESDGGEAVGAEDRGNGADAGWGDGSRAARQLSPPRRTVVALDAHSETGSPVHRRCYSY